MCVLTEITLCVVAENRQTILLPCMLQHRQEESCIHSDDYVFAKALWTSFFHHQTLHNNDSPEQITQMAKALEMESGCLAVDFRLADYVLF